MRCDDAHCITCSDEGVPMRVRDVRDDGVAVCEDGRRLDGAPAEPVEVMIDLVAPVEPGDELLVHAGVALTRLT